MPELNDVMVATGSKTTEIPLKTEVVEATTVTKPKAKKPVSKPKTESKKEVTETSETKPKFVRPAMEMLTREFEQLITSLTIDKQPIVKLDSKCGKAIFGIKSKKEKAKHFRIFAFKIRGKHKTVEGKSRCVYFFGTTKDMSKHIKELPGLRTCKDYVGTVQSKHAVELTLDKVTFADHFNQDINKVMDTLKKITTITIEQKTEQYQEFITKTTEE